jgi:protein-tyrosine phosphatase
LRKLIALKANKPFYEKQMTKILMVCLGNICRSPVAEGIMRKKIAEKNLNATVDSAGTSNFHIGEAPDKRSQKNAIKNGVNISNLRGRQFSEKDFNDFDLILTMDQSNYDSVIALATTKEQKSKVSLILNHISGSSLKEVPDPYFGGEVGFQQVFDLLDEACEEIVRQL